MWRRNAALLSLISLMAFSVSAPVPIQAQSESSSVSRSIDDESHTHFRYGHYFWKAAGGTTIEFTLQNAFRRNGYSCVDPGTLGTVACSTPDGFPGVGDVFGEFIGGTQFFPGDGSSIGSLLGPLLYLVTLTDPGSNWLFALALDPTSLPAVDTTINHTYAAPGDYVAFTDSCCRISAVSGVNAHINNPDGGYRVETFVNVGSGNNSPISVLPPIVQCPIDTVCSFPVGGADPDGDALNFRLSASAEASSFGAFTQPGPPNAPNSASISPAGLYTWDTTGATVGPAGTNTLYSTQVTIEDLDGSGAVKSKVAVDFFIQVVPCPPAGCDPPVFPPPPPGTPPVCETTQVANVGGTLAFDVTASDPDAGDTVTLNVFGLPLGATMNPSLPLIGNPIASEFSWTPTLADVGTVVLTFFAASPDGSALCPVTIEVSAGPVASFDWSMPARFVVEDPSGDPIIFDHTDGEVYLAPGVDIDPDAGWRVDFDACASVDTAQIDAYLWVIEGGALGLVEATVCDEFSFHFADEGEYEVSLTVVDEPSLKSSTVVHTVVVEDFLIVSIGDSVASGEGNPDVSASCLLGGLPPCTGFGNAEIPPVWQSRRCHRSAAAGPAQAGVGLENYSQKSSVTFIHLACSGATVQKGLLGKYDGVETFGPKFEAQVTRAIELTMGRDIDALLISIGANDIGFSSIVTECILDLFDFGDECVDEISEDLLTGGTRFGFGKKKDPLSRLATRLDELAACLGFSSAESDADCPLDEVLDASAESVIITSYHDPIRSGPDTYCSGILDFVGLGEGLSETEAMWASNDLLRGVVSFTPGKGKAPEKHHAGLNQTIGAAATRYAWVHLADVTEAFATHGYCTGEERWIVTRLDSLANGSGDIFGAPGVLHPNRLGHGAYAGFLLDELTAGL